MAHCVISAVYDTDTDRMILAPSGDVYPLAVQ